MPRFLNRGLRIASDLAVLSLAYWLAYLFRFEFLVPPTGVHVFLLSLPYVLVIEYGGLALLGVPRMSWRYLNMRDTVRVLVAVTCSSATLFVVRVVLPFVVTAPHVPMGAIAMNFALAFLGLVGV